MLKHNRAAIAAAAMSCLIASPCAAQTVKAAPAAGADTGGSAYLKCDGQPNNYTTGEAAARLLGAVTLLGLFAPNREGPDASKRVKGAGGVAACTPLIEGERREGNPERRVGLILARALHHIEDKTYDAALADVDLGEREATAAGLTADSYWERSRRRSFGLIRSAAQFRLGRVAEARATALATTRGVEQALLPMLVTPTYPAAADTDAAELAFRTALARLDFEFLPFAASRLEEAGRFREAASDYDALIDALRAINPDKRQSILLLVDANDAALAGDRSRAKALVDDARANAEARRNAGEPENQASLVEGQDLNAILMLMADGDAKAARRLFAARSQWTSVPFGQSVEVLRRLRTDATPDELVGGLAKSPEQLRRDRADGDRAEMLAKDGDNRTLFQLVQAAVPARSYEAVAPKVWKVDGSKLILKPSTKPNPGIPYDLLFLPAADIRVLPEAYMLHAALLARSRGHEGFTIHPIIKDGLIAARISTGKRGGPGFAEPLFNDAAAVITALRGVIPDPETLKARRPGA